MKKNFVSPTGLRIHLGLGHLRDDVVSVAFHPNGKMIASASNDDSLRLWDAETMREIACPVGVTSGVNQVAFSPDGKLLGFSDNYGISVWSIETHSIVWQAKAESVMLRRMCHRDSYAKIKALNPNLFKNNEFWIADKPNPYRQLSFSPDGLQLGAIKNHRLEIRNAINGTRLPEVWFGSEFKISAFAFSPSGKSIVLGSTKGIIRIIDTYTHEVITQFKTIGATINWLGLSGDERFLVSLNAIGVVDTYDLAQSKLLYTRIAITSLVKAVALSPDGTKMALTGDYNNPEICDYDSEQYQVSVFDIESGEQTNSQIKKSRSGGKSLAFSPDGKKMAIGVNWGMIQVVGLNADAVPTECYGLSQFRKWVVTFNTDDTELMLISNSESIQGIDLKTMQTTQITNSYRWNDVDAFDPMGQLIAIGGNREIELFDLQTNTVRHNLEIESRYSKSCLFSADGKLFASDSGENVRVWDCTTGNLLGSFGMDNKVAENGVKFSPDGKILYAASNYDSYIRKFDLFNPENINTFNFDLDDIFVFDTSRDGSKIIAASENAVIEILDIEKNISLLKIKTMLGKIRTVLFSADGSKFYITTEQWLSVWDSESGKMVELIPSAGGVFINLTLSSNGKILVAACENGGMYFINPLTDKVTCTAYLSQSGEIVATTPDGYFTGTPEMIERYISVTEGLIPVSESERRAYIEQYNNPYYVSDSIFNSIEK